MGKRKCPRCDGYGFEFKLCEACKGSGVNICRSCGGNGWSKSWSGQKETCWGCNGTGKDHCPVCKGTGEMRGNECGKCDGRGYLDA